VTCHIWTAYCGSFEAETADDISAAVDGLLQKER